MFDSLPAAPDTAPERARIRQAIEAGAPKLVVLDDDPTGTQTVHGIDVLAEWSEDTLVAALRDPRPAFYLLTNSRALTPPEAEALNRQIAERLLSASRKTGVAFTLVSRSDSTLRGHFPLEVDVWCGALAPVDAFVVAPAFFEGGRYTVGNIHYVAEGTRMVPAAETEFAKDATFGYSNSDLTRWIEEKTRGRISASQVASVGIELLRTAGAAGVVRLLLSLPKGSAVVLNAAAYADLEIFVDALLRPDLADKRFVFRTAAGFVRVRAGLEQKPVLSAAEIAGPGRGRGLVIVGSYVGKSTEQLRHVLGEPGTTEIEVEVDRLGEENSRVEEIARVVAAADAAILAGGTAVAYTSRKLVSKVGRAGELSSAQLVSATLVEILRSIRERPRFIIAKGGITSSDLAVRGLGMRRALIVGQAAPGIPVWKVEGDRFSGIPYIVFPGNVGTPETLRDLVRALADG